MDQLNQAQEQRQLSPEELQRIGLLVASALDVRLTPEWRNHQADMLKIAPIARGQQNTTEATADYLELLYLGARFGSFLRRTAQPTPTPTPAPAQPQEQTPQMLPEEISKNIQVAYAKLEQRLGPSWRQYEREMQRLLAVARAEDRSPIGIVDHLEMIYLAARYASFSRMAHPDGAVAQ